MMAINKPKKIFYLHFPLAVYCQWDSKGWMIHASFLLFGFGFGRHTCRLPYFGTRMSFWEIMAVPRIPMNEGGEYFLFKYERKWDRRLEEEAGGANL